MQHYRFTVNFRQFLKCPVQRLTGFRIQRRSLGQHAHIGNGHFGQLVRKHLPLQLPLAVQTKVYRNAVKPAFELRILHFKLFLVLHHAQKHVLGSVHGVAFVFQHAVGRPIHHTGVVRVDGFKIPCGQVSSLPSFNTLLPLKWLHPIIAWRAIFIKKRVVNTRGNHYHSMWNTALFLKAFLHISILLAKKEITPP